MAKRGGDRQDGDGAGVDLDVDVLKADAKNARRISKAALAGLKFSMHQFGDLSGIVWNEEEGVGLVTGHQRMAGLTAAGAKTWTRLSESEGFIEHPKTGERFRIRIVRWDAEKHRQAQIVANNPHIQGDYTEDVVEQLRELQDSLLFDALKLDELQGELDKEAAAVEAEFERSAGAQDQSGKIRDKYALMIECETEEQQRSLLARLADEGLNVRAIF